MPHAFKKGIDRSIGSVAMEQVIHQTKRKYSENGPMVDPNKLVSVDNESRRLVEEKGTE